eukprot:CAMPEP_0206587636 /NCGR_PEP_ID=MMETSP0325_2-20121206/37772_1 /ASSEMBLY_ACC=CAM_ASM_000347 /TAXON_ID=2866 /ORGANISM="Crypthecodinium cohnii, Strain Seligo" /LENGTH=294 /DNA_ID=CAMNT_0054095695 /DNA_START=226 /DNA_END=1107 /DNA_ORIENTATION=+
MGRLVPEQGTITEHLFFCIIGLGAKAVVDGLVHCGRHSSVFDMLHQPQPKDEVPPKKKVPEKKGTFASLGPKHEETVRDVYFILDEDEMHIAKVKLKPVESFQDSISDMKLDGQELRNTCFIFILDERLDLKVEVIPILETSLVEMRFLYNAAKKRSANSRIRRLLLTHQSAPAVNNGSSNSNAQVTVSSFKSDIDNEKSIQSDTPHLPGDISLDLSTSAESLECEEVKKFLAKLTTSEMHGNLTQPRRKVNLDDPDSVFSTIQRLTRELLSLNTDAARSSRLTATFQRGSSEK